VVVSDEGDRLPDCLTLSDTSAKVFECSCGWSGFLFDWNDDDALDEQRDEAMRHVTTEH
jgi:peptide methionine sulfoxide reductase MsrB